MTTHRPEFRVSRPGALIAALPAVLGFVPEKSLVIVSLEDGRMGSVMRADLSAELRQNLDRLAEVVAASGAQEALAVIVDAEGAGCPMCNADHRQLCDELRTVLAGVGVELNAAHVVDRVESGGGWHCVDGCGAGGVVDDPTSSPLAVAAVLDGRRLYRSRGDLEAVIRPTEPARAARLSAAIEDHSTIRQTRWQDDPDGQARRDIENTIALADRLVSGHEPTDTDLAELVCGLTDVSVRDTLYSLAVGARAGAAEALWGALARTVPDPWRVEALVLLAFSAYARGDGPLAGISLEAALRSAPEHRMASMLDTALQSGMRPEQIRELTGTGFRLARRLGVHLPPPRIFGQAV